MTTWTSDELTKIGEAEELEIASRRRDGTFGRWVTIWVVRHGDELYVRSVNGPSAAWFRGTQTRQPGRIRAGGVEKDVALVDASHERADQIDAAYRTKYRRYAESIVESIIAPQARATTLKLAPHRPPQEDDVQITRNSLDTNPGPSDWFTGVVFVDPIAAPAPPARTAAASVHFTPGARTAWHTHPLGQTIFVTEGIGRCQREGGPVEEIRPGDRVFFEPRENHWHGAAPNRFMTHIAIQEVDDDGSPVTWGEHVTDEQYSAAPAA